MKKFILFLLIFCLCGCNYKELDKMGLKGINQDNIDKYIKYTQQEIGVKKKTPVEQLNDDQAKRHQEIVNYFKNLNNQEIASKIVDESLTIFKGKEFVQTGKTLVIAATPFAQTIAEDKLDTRNIVDMLREFVKTVDAETLDFG